MSNARARLCVAIIVIAGACAALGARIGLSNARAALVVAVALAAIWGVGSVAIARLSGRSPLLFTPTLAVFVLSMVAVVVSMSGHLSFLLLAVVNLAVSVWLMWSALRHDAGRQR